MVRSDFAWVVFDVQLNENNQQHTESFNIEGNPLDRGNAYLLIQAFDVEYDLHRIFINGQALPSFDLPKQSKKGIYTTWMDRVPQSFLQSGANKITIKREDNDDFYVANVMVQWREED